jgi:hypothetical protein
MKYDQMYLEKIVDVYQPQCSKKLTTKDAEEIADSTIGLGSLLRKLHKKYLAIEHYEFKCKSGKLVLAYWRASGILAIYNTK